MDSVYRPLEDGEIIAKDDEWYDDSDNTWNPIISCIGETVYPSNFKIRRKINNAGTPEPAPLPGKLNIADLVQIDINDRVAVGLERYGTKLQSHNGRDALMDLYQELIDAVMYTRQLMAERDGK